MTPQPERPQSRDSAVETGNAPCELRTHYTFLPKDFIETIDGLLAAVVAHGTESSLAPILSHSPASQPGQSSRVLVYPRYQRLAEGGLRKLRAGEAVELVARHFPHYQWWSPQRDVQLTAIPLSSIARHYCPELMTQRWGLEHHNDIKDIDEPALSPERGQAQMRVATILGHLLPHAGITGSRLIGAERRDSDLDLVVYGRQHFDRVRQRLVEAVSVGVLSELSEADWRRAYVRRGATGIAFDDYVWHEQRKRNKFLLRSTLCPQDIALDLSCVDTPHPASQAPGRKLGPQTITTRILSDQHGFNTPAVFELDHARVRWLVINTATYVGQGRIGETIEATGCAEAINDDSMRLVVGASREAPGESVRVVR